MSFIAELKCAFRSFTRAQGLALTVIVTLALGIGANAAMFTVVRGVLLRPLVNRDESRLIYIPADDVPNAAGVAVLTHRFTGRTHRMTELFGRLAPGADLEAARTELRTVYGAIREEHPEAYPQKSDFRIDAKLPRDQITSPARTVLLVLLAASALIFVIACSNVANLILSRAIEAPSRQIAAS